MKIIVKTILSPIKENVYDPEIHVEMEDLLSYYRSTGCTDFALLDALSLEYYGKIELL